MKIKIEDLNVILGKKLILDTVSLDFTHQKFTGIIGPNGSGKSTL